MSSKTANNALTSTIRKVLTTLTTALKQITSLKIIKHN